MDMRTSTYDGYAASPHARSAGQAWPVGARIGRYHVERCVGAGAMGAVYEAVHTLLRKRVALKLPHAGDALSDGALVRFLREAESAARVRHPNALDITDVGVEGRTPFMVMEFLEGEDLAQRIARDGRLDAQRAADVIVPIVAALAAAHKLGILHGDIKPENVFLAVDDRGRSVPKLLDFGLSRDLESGASHGPGTGAKLAGTPYYMAPEQLRGIPPDPRTDQYALGVMLYQCLTGARPFEGNDLCELMLAIDHGVHRNIHTLCDHVPEALAQVVERAMAHDMEARFPDTEALGRALLPFASEAVRNAHADEFGGARRRSTPPQRWADEDLARRCADLMGQQPKPTSLEFAATMIQSLEWSECPQEGIFGPRRPRAPVANARASYAAGLIAVLVSSVALSLSGSHPVLWMRDTLALELPRGVASP